MRKCLTVGLVLGGLFLAAAAGFAEDVSLYQDALRDFDLKSSEIQASIERMQATLDVRSHELEFFRLRSVCHKLVLQINGKIREFDRVKAYPSMAQRIFDEIKSLNADYEKAGEDLKSFVNSLGK